MKRKKREEYVEGDAQLNKILITLGTEEVKLKNLFDGKELSQKQLTEILELLESLDKYSRSIKRHGGEFESYLNARDKKTEELPRHLVKIRSGNDETIQYFHNEDELAKFAKTNIDLGLFENEDENEETLDKLEGKEEKAEAKNATTRRCRHVELHESKAIGELLHNLSKKGFEVDHYKAQDKPLFELIEGKKEHMGTIKSVDETHVFIETPAGDITIPIEKINKAVQQIPLR